MKHLLERWATLEPHLCKRETRPNKDWHEEFEDYKLISPDGNQVYLVYSDKHPSGWMPSKEMAMARIQWAVQQAIIERGWYFEMYYTPFTYNEAIITVVPSKAKAYSQNSMAEALLTAYLEVLSANS